MYIVKKNKEVEKFVFEKTQEIYSSMNSSADKLLGRVISNQKPPLREGL